MVNSNVPQKIRTVDDLIATAQQVYQADKVRRINDSSPSPLVNDIIDALIAKYELDSGRKLSVLDYIRVLDFSDFYEIVKSRAGQLDELPELSKYFLKEMTRLQHQE